MSATTAGPASLADDAPDDPPAEPRWGAQRFLPLTGGLLFLAGWEAAVRLLHVSKFILPPPSAILETLWLQREALLRALGYTAAISLSAFALAIVSGRRLFDIKHFLDPAEITMVAEHGAVIRMTGATEAQSIPLWPPHWRRSLDHFERCWPGVEIEEKTFGVAIHFRGAPQAAKAVHDMAHALASGSEGAYEVIAAKMAYELRRPGIDKGVAVRNLMLTPVFNGRVPVFIGDDVTDHDGFAAVAAAGGIALDVAIAFDNRPDLVRDWLRSFAKLEPVTS